MRVVHLIAVLIIAGGGVGAVYLHDMNNSFYIQTDGLTGYKIDKKTGETWMLAGDSETLVKAPLRDTLKKWIRQQSNFNSLSPEQQVEVFDRINTWTLDQKFLTLDLQLQENIIGNYLQSNIPGPGKATGNGIK